MIEGLSNECGELFHDLNKGGLAQICRLPRCHHGPHGHIEQRPQTEAVVEQNTKFNSFVSSLLDDIKIDKQPVVPECLIEKKE
jgi:hypothetical protein